MRTNFWSAFQAILPAGRRIVGTVSAHHADGSASVVLPEGSAMIVRGHLDATPPYRAFVVDGVLESRAPTLPVIATEA